MNLPELREQYKGQLFIPYAQLLLTDEWRQRRDQIIRRDNHAYRHCGNEETEIHHDDDIVLMPIPFWWGPVVEVHLP